MDSRKKNEGVASRRRKDFGLLKQRVDGQVLSAQEYIDALRQDLARYRRENEDLRRQCNRLERAETNLDVTRLEISELTSRSRASATDNDRLHALAGSLEEENSQLASRCEELETSMAHERESRILANREIAYLQEQVDQLESMVELLAKQLDLDDMA